MLQTNGVTKSDVKKEVTKQEFDNPPKRKGDEKNTNDTNDRINTTNVDLTFFPHKVIFEVSLK